MGCRNFPVMADEAKAKGNAAFSAGKYEEAIQHFGDAIALAPDNHVLYSNRSAAYASLHKYQDALRDAKKTVELKPEWPKSYSRLGAAHVGLRDYEEAITAYKKGLQYDPGNDGLKSGLADAQAAKPRARAPGGDSAFGGGSPFGNMFGPDVWVKLQGDPRTRQYLQQPDFVAMINDAQKNPSNVSRYINDPRMMQVIGVLLGVNLQTAEPGAEFPEDGTTEEVSSSPSMPEERPRSVPTQATPEVPPEATKRMEVDEDDETKAKKAKKAEALKEKEAGNAEYKKKNFEAAVQHYTKALELDGEDISYITNRAAVYMEMGKVRVVKNVECGSKLTYDSGGCLNCYWLVERYSIHEKLDASICIQGSDGLIRRLVYIMFRCFSYRYCNTMQKLCMSDSCKVLRGDCSTRIALQIVNSLWRLAGQCMPIIN